MGSGNFKRVGDWVHIENKTIKEYVHSPAPKNYSRTYMPGYDMGDWLTVKTDKEIYTIIKITNISTESKYNSFYGNIGKDDLFIYYEAIEVKEMPKTVDTNGFKRMVRWELDRWDNNCMTYSDLLKRYRPLTETEKLLYAQEE